MLLAKSLLAVAAGLLALVHASNVVELQAADFDKTIGTGTPALVEFYAPWCGHCKNLAPTYELLADAYAHSSDVIIAKVDADAEKELAGRFGVKGYPTLKWFSKDGIPEDYSGGRELQNLADFVTQKSQVKSKIKPPPPSAVTQLNYLTLEETINDPTKDVMVAFTASWCGHCKSLKPTYEKVANNYKSEHGIIIANFECDAEPNKPLAEQHGIKSFPTLKFYPKGSDKTPIAYEQGRSEQDFLNFINEQTGAHRTVNGGLNDQAGRNSKLDEYARKFFSSSPANRRSIYEDVKGLEEEIIRGSEHYIRAMEKVLNGTTDYVEKELKRLSALLEKQTLSDQKLDQIKMKANVLYAFTEKELPSESKDTDPPVKDEL